MFWIKQLRLGPLHLSVVRNIPMSQHLRRRVGWFFTWSSRWACGTLRIRSICFNLDFDLR